MIVILKVYNPFNEPRRGDTELFIPLKQIFFIVIYLKFVQKIDVFFSESFLSVMLFLIEYVIIDILNMRLGVGKRSEAFLPGKTSSYPAFIVDVIRGIVFHVPCQIRYGHGWFQSYKRMNMVCRPVDDDGFVAFVGDYSSNVLVQVGSP